MRYTTQIIAERIIHFLRESLNNSVPRKIIEIQFEEKFSLTAIRESISFLLNEYITNLVVDYPEDDSTLYDGTPIWHLKLLDSEERKILRNLSPIKRALLKILHETDDSDVPGELPIEEAAAILRSKGFDEEQIKWIHVEGLVEHVITTIGGVSEKCFRLIPEYEKTEEYKKSQEEREKEWLENHIERQKFIDEEDRKAEERMNKSHKKNGSG